jgi:nitrogen fixation NifU-like protein
MMDLDSLYQELILDHNASPRNFGSLSSATHHAEGSNPLCGDNLEVELEVRGGVIQDVRFRGSGCAISTASSSLMTTALKGKTVEEAESLFASFHEMVTAGDDNAELSQRLGKLAALGGVRQFPARVKCATLAWHTVHAALHGEATVTTE